MVGALDLVTAEEEESSRSPHMTSRPARLVKIHIGFNRRTKRLERQRSATIEVWLVYPLSSREVEAGLADTGAARNGDGAQWTKIQPDRGRYGFGRLVDVPQGPGRRNCLSMMGYSPDDGQLAVQDMTMPDWATRFLTTFLFPELHSWQSRGPRRYVPQDEPKGSAGTVSPVKLKGTAAIERFKAVRLVSVAFACFFLAPCTPRTANKQTDLRILFLCTAHNSLSQQPVLVTVEYALSDAAMVEAAGLFKPHPDICPFLTTRPIPDLNCSPRATRGCWAEHLTTAPKTNQHGRMEYGSALRHRDPRSCLIGALAFWLFWRWQVEKAEKFPSSKEAKTGKGFPGDPPDRVIRRISATLHSIVYHYLNLLAGLEHETNWERRSTGVSYYAMRIVYLQGRGSHEASFVASAVLSHPLLGQKKSPRGDPHLWQDKPSTMTATGDQSVPREERVLLAVRAYQQGQFKSTRKAAAAYDVLNRQYLIDCAMNNLKLTATEETALVQWILSMDERGCRRQWLTLRGKDPVGENWVRKFVGRHGEIKAKYSRRYDYQRAKCEDPQKIQGWYDRVAATKQKWGILDEDVYNFDETGFQMGVAATARVLTRSDRRGRAVLTQPGNREWVTVIESINCQGWALPAKVIFQGKLHQASWYESGVPDDWHIAVSENGWTSDDLALNWLKEVFDPNTRRRTVGTHRLLILDGHGSHVTPEFDKYCTANSIVVLQMPAHSSHLLQPLDVGCFSPLKTIYGRKVQEKMLAGIHHIDKQDFLPMYLDARRQALSPSNIRSGFMATGLFPFDPNRVLSRLQVQVDKVGNDHGDKNTPSPNKSLEAAKTPHNVNQLTTHAERLLQRRPQNTDSPVSQAINQLIKGCQMAMHSAALLADENRQLRSENQRRKQRKNSAVNTLATAVLYRIKQRREEEEERVKRRRVEEEERTKRRREKDEERAKRRQEGEERAERRRQENEEWFKLRREKEEERVKKQRAKEDERAKRRREEGRDQRLIEELSVPRQLQVF
ncbi:DDE superfamily endonuclease [Hirsutella rhossiliensis]